MTIELTRFDLDVLARTAEMLLPKPPKPRRWASPLDMACELDPTMVRTPALEALNAALMDLIDGPDDRLMVSFPPQEGKSTAVSRWFPEFVLSQVDPDMRIIEISYADEIARRWGADVKRDFEAYSGEDGAPDLGIRLRGDSRAAGRWQVDGHIGGMFCAGVAGSSTGRPCNLMIIDDPIKDLEQAQSATYRERFQRFWQGVAVPRLGPGAKVVLVQTRWHEEDAAGWLLATEGDKSKGGRWRVVNIPAIAEDDNDPLGREPGEPMQSARGDRDWDATRKSVGEYVWASLYQGRPAPAEGGLFKRLWWRYWSPAPTAGMGERVDLGGRIWALGDCWKFGTIDLANSTKTSADWTVAAVWAVTLDGDLVLLDFQRARVGEEHHFDLVRPLADRWRADTFFVERSQYGTTLARDAARTGVHLTPIDPESDKFSRALPYSARASAGRVWLPAGSPEKAKIFVDEHAAFPNGSHDDIVDCGSYAVRVAVTKWQPPPPRPQPDLLGGNVELDYMSMPL